MPCKVNDGRCLALVDNHFLSILDMGVRIFSVYSSNALYLVLPAAKHLGSGAEPQTFYNGMRQGRFKTWRFLPFFAFRAR